MTAFELMEAMGEINGTYVAAAQRYRERPARRRPPLRLLLVAAILALLLTGCAVVYALRLETMKVGQMKFPQSQGFETLASQGTVTLDILSLQGIQGSPNYNAAREWFDFQQSYQQQLGVQPLTEEEETRYISYACYDRAMADRLDEILAKYGLELHGEWFHEVDMKDAYALLEIPGILRTEPLEEYSGGMFFQDGSFRVEGAFTPADCPWPHPVSFSYLYTMKHVFDDVFQSMNADAVVDEWTYQTADGSQVLLVLGEKRAHIYADQTEAFVSISITNNDYPTPFAMEKSELEAVADLFDFTIRPKPLDEAEADTARRLQETAIQARMEEDPMVVDSYGAYAKNYLSHRPMTEPRKLEYAVRDMNGDGTEELVIFYERQVSDIVTMENGKTRWFGGNGRPWVWCEGDFFIDRFSFGECGEDYHDEVIIIRRFEGIKKFVVRQFRHYDSVQWKEEDPFTSLPIADLSDEKIEQIMADYPPLDLDTLNLKPLEALANAQ
ncbi:MAG: hypothetical protein Q4F17_05305 [Eubacteriales bacterium]|nr:hypothetical protein [Eubacteriales bacterium]